MESITVGLCNAPARIMRLVTEMLRPFLNKFWAIYFDDILIFSQGVELHIEHLKLVLSALRQSNLYLNSAKCQFAISRISFLGFAIDENGIHTYPNKIEDIHSWSTPSSVAGVLLGASLILPIFTGVLLETSAPSLDHLQLH